MDSGGGRFYGVGGEVRVGAAASGTLGATTREGSGLTLGPRRAGADRAAAAPAFDDPLGGVGAIAGERDADGWPASSTLTLLADAEIPPTPCDARAAVFKLSATDVGATVECLATTPTPTTAVFAILLDAVADVRFIGPCVEADTGVLRWTCAGGTLAMGLWARAARELNRRNRALRATEFMEAPVL